MTPLAPRVRAAVLLGGYATAVVALMIVLGGTAQAAHCDNDPGTTGIPDCEPGHVVVDGSNVTDDPSCAPMSEPAPVMDWAATYEPCEPAYARDTSEVVATFDPTVVSILSSLRVLLAVGLSLLALLSSATLVLTAVNR